MCPSVSPKSPNTFSSLKPHRLNAGFKGCVWRVLSLSRRAGFSTSELEFSLLLCVPSQGHRKQSFGVLRRCLRTRSIMLRILYWQSVRPGPRYLWSIGWMWILPRLPSLRKLFVYWTACFVGEVSKTLFPCAVCRQISGRSGTRICLKVGYLSVHHFCNYLVQLYIRLSSLSPGSFQLNM